MLKQVAKVPVDGENGRELRIRLHLTAEKRRIVYKIQPDFSFTRHRVEDSPGVPDQVHHLTAHAILGYICPNTTFISVLATQDPSSSNLSLVVLITLGLDLVHIIQFFCNTGKWVLCSYQ